MLWRHRSAPSIAPAVGAVVVVDERMVSPGCSESSAPKMAACEAWQRREHRRVAHVGEMMLAQLWDIFGSLKRLIEVNVRLF